jgi:hypothetical protein
MTMVIFTTRCASDAGARDLVLGLRIALAGGGDAFLVHLNGGAQRRMRWPRFEPAW